MTTPLQHTWLSKLMGCDNEIVYKKGSGNSVADALSRVSGADVFTLVVSSLQPLLLDRIVDSYSAYVDIQQLLSELMKDIALSSVSRFSYDGKLLRRKGRLVVGNDGALRREILAMCYDSSWGGHSGFNSTYQRLRSLFY